MLLKNAAGVKKGATIGAMKEVVGSITKEQLAVSAKRERTHSQRSASESERKRGPLLPSAITRFHAVCNVALCRR